MRLRDAGFPAVAAGTTPDAVFSERAALDCGATAPATSAAALI